jgi:hypothetical protein
MNELCAIFFYVSSQGLVPTTPTSEETEKVTYALFDAFMNRFGYADMFYQTSVLGQPTSPSSVDSSKPISPLLRRCEKIFELLHIKDPRLHKHFVTNDISPNLFLLRWIRILFAREFPFDQTLVIWDFIFAHVPIGKHIPFPSVIDYIAIAMIVNIRADLLQSDNAGCFTKLLKYPKPHSIGQLLDLAIKVRDNEITHPVQAPSIAPVFTRRDKIVADLNAVVSELRSTNVSESISAQIFKLEEIISFIKK